MSVFKKLKTGDHIHLMGICGTAMGSLAGLLKDLGYKVTGSDENVYPPMSDQLADLDIQIMQGFKKENLSPHPDLVIVGNVITRSHEEAVALLASDIPYTSLPQAIGEVLIADRKSAVICGTHGKTTTTALFAWISECADQAPGYLIGGIPKNFDRSFRVPNKDLFVIEGDEYDTAFFDKVPKFTHYKPKYVILTSVEFDHADIYNSMDDVRAAFKMLMDLIPEDGVLIANGDQDEVRKLAETCRGQVYYYGFDENNDYQILNAEWTSRGTSIAIGEKDAKTSITSPLYGRHNAMNSVAAYALAREMDYDRQKTVRAIRSFEGVKRRQEIIGEPGGVTVIDDFAHHPEAVSGTIQAVQERFAGQTVYSVFEPRSATSRSDIFEKEYEEAFSKADHMILAQVFSKKILDGHQALDIKNIVKRLKDSGKDIDVLLNSDSIVSHITERAKPGDVVLVMSNGGFDGIYKKLLDSLETKPSKQ